MQSYTHVIPGMHRSAPNEIADLILGPRGQATHVCNRGHDLRTPDWYAGPPASRSVRCAVAVATAALRNSGHHERLGSLVRAAH
jgi:hypothetical protein